MLFIATNRIVDAINSLITIKKGDEKVLAAIVKNLDAKKYLMTAILGLGITYFPLNAMVCQTKKNLFDHLPNELIIIIADYTCYQQSQSYNAIKLYNLQYRLLCRLCKRFNQILHSESALKIMGITDLRSLLDENNKEKKWGVTPLGRAIGDLDPVAVKKLLASGANPNKKSKEDHKWTDGFDMRSKRLPRDFVILSPFVMGGKEQEEIRQILLQSGAMTEWDNQNSVVTVKPRASGSSAGGVVCLVQ